MKKWKAFCAGLVTLAGLTPSLWAQVPATPAVPGAAPPATFFQSLGLTKEQKEALKRKCCKTPLGQLLNNMMMPLSAFTGGIFNCCPTTPGPEDLAKGGAEGAAAKIKKDEAESKARRAAVRYLGTVDCHYWPEAEAQLIASLRADRIECVRWEAAMALGGGCCCTKRTIEALLISATGSDKDGNPGETCERVKAAAFGSLQHCLACFSEEVPADPKKPEKPVPAPEKPQAAADSGSNVLLTAYYQKLNEKPMAQVIREARLAAGETTFASASAVKMPTGAQSLSNIVTGAFNIGVTPVSTNGEATAAAEKPGSELELAGVEKVSTGKSHRIIRDDEETIERSYPVRGVLASFFSLPRSSTVKTVGERSGEMKPGETRILETKPVETKPVESKPATMKKIEINPVSTKPIETKPVAMKPLPARPALVKPVEMKPMLVQPVERMPIRTNPVDMKPTEVKPIGSLPPISVQPVPQQLPERQPMPVSQTQPTTGPNAQQLLLVLRNSNYAVQREWAVDSLSSLNWRSHPEVAQTILSSACKDPSQAVRIKCIRSVVKMKMDSAPVLTTLRSLSLDADRRVAQEAEQALARLGVSPATPMTPAGQAAGTTMSSVRPAVYGNRMQPVEMTPALQPVSYKPTTPATMSTPAQPVSYKPTTPATMTPSAQPARLGNIQSISTTTGTQSSAPASMAKPSMYPSQVPATTAPTQPSSYHGTVPSSSTAPTQSSGASYYR